MKYKRVVITRRGGPEVLQVVEDELPEPQSGEVRVKILAAGVSFADVMIREVKVPGLGTPPMPFSPGADLVGVVDKLGDGVSTVELGQMVAARPTFGSHAEFICLPATELMPVPSGLDPAEAVCLVVDYVLAYQVLHRAARVRPGERILIHGAAGGTGTALLQLGKLAGLEMYGTASSGKHELVASLGATPIDYKKEDFVKRIRILTGDGVDVVTDPIGGAHVRRSYKTLRRGGRLVIYGAYSVVNDGILKSVGGLMFWGKILNLIPDKRAAMTYFMDKPKSSSPEWCREDLSKLFDLLAQEKIKPIIERMPLVEAARAHELLGKAS